MLEWESAENIEMRNELLFMLMRIAIEGTLKNTQGPLVGAGLR